MKRNIVIAVVTAAALVGGGAATALAVSGDDDGPAPVAQTESRAGDDDGRDDDGQDDDGRNDDSRDDDRDERAVPSGVTAADAIAAALKHTPGTAVSAELDDDDDDNGGKAVWEVDVLGGGDTWHSVRVDPGSGKVLGASKDDEDDADEVRAALKGASVTAGEAAEAAAAKGTVTSVDLDDDDDKGWEAETRASSGGERDWRVDLGSGSVTADRDDDGGDSDDD
ncbi:PepSY domain-containing protein [Streptomyces atrovirens]|uniref:PepSY domain-containing protein n=1 Tax=Streptomyces atrovirens TaxID=285556 RepID=A0ABW0E0W8_9ACTN